MERQSVTRDANPFAGRPVRVSDHAAENRALMELARAQSGTRDRLLQKIADTALTLCGAGSAGISLVEGHAGGTQFRWLAVAGLCAALRGKTTAWGECPCGATLDAGVPQLFVRPQAHFPCLQFPGVDVTEGVVVPIATDGMQLGAIWVMSHDTDRQFDLEDVRLLSNLAVFAGTALTLMNTRDLGEESDQRHNEFIAMLGHELRNPMAPIDSAITAAKLLSEENGKAFGVLTIAQRQMRHLRTLVDDLLDAARLKHGKLAIKYSNSSLNEIAFDAVTAIRHQIESRKHTLTLTGLDSPISVHADHVRLSQVLGNLLSNAAKYTPVGGVIELKVDLPALEQDALPPGSVTITVKDNGIGIDPSVQPHVFDLFSQSVRGRARAEGGLGIGLAVAKRMVELHEGSISIHSDGIGQGTVVSIRLPILQSGLTGHFSEARNVARAVSPLRILLVDDNQDALRALGILLELEGHSIIMADNGRDAIRMAAGVRPDVAIVDVGMPEIDGFDVARAVRSEDSLAGVLLIALTGYASESDRSRALAAGFDHHLSKPISLEKLHHIFESSVSGKTGSRS